MSSQIANIVPLATTLRMLATVNGVLRNRSRSITGLLLRRSTATHAMSRTPAATNPPSTIGEPQPEAPPRLIASRPAARPAPTSTAPGRSSDPPRRRDGPLPSRSAGGGMVDTAKASTTSDSGTRTKYTDRQLVHWRRSPPRAGPMASPIAAPIWKNPNARLRAASGTTRVTSAGAAPRTERGTRPLHHPRQEEPAVGVHHATQADTDRGEDEAGGEHSSMTERVAQPSGCEQQTGEREDVGRHDPLDLADVDRERGRDRREGDVHHRVQRDQRPGRTDDSDRGPRSPTDPADVGGPVRHRSSVPSECHHGPSERHSARRADVATNQHRSPPERRCSGGGQMRAMAARIASTTTSGRWLWM